MYSDFGRKESKCLRLSDSGWNIFTLIFIRLVEESTFVVFDHIGNCNVIESSQIVVFLQSRFSQIN